MVSCRESPWDHLTSLARMFKSAFQSHGYGEGGGDARRQGRLRSQGARAGADRPRRGPGGTPDTPRGLGTCPVRPRRCLADSSCLPSHDVRDSDPDRESSARSFDAVVAAVEAEGLASRGAFHVTAHDAVPPFADGTPAATLVLVGNAGPGMWSVFAASDESNDGRPDALDRWSGRVVSRLACSLGGAAHFPFGGPPWRPFIRWAQRAGPVYPSPIGPLVHPEFGLWHAYRGAIAFRERLDLPPRDERPSPCESCAERPCLSSCPVGAFFASGYDVEACVAHIESRAGARCLTAGCLARHACPVGRETAYDASQGAFHMRAFLAARRRNGQRT